MSEKNKGAPDYITEGDGYADITLASPAVINGAKTATLRMREPDVSDLETSNDSKDSAAKAEIALFANLCEIAPEDIRKLKLRNYSRLQAAFSLFTN